MDWIICLVTAILLLVFSIGSAVCLSRSHTKRRLLKPLNIILAGAFLASLILHLPVFYNPAEGETPGLFKTLMMGLHSTFQVFTIDSDRGIILESIHCPAPWLDGIYSGLLSILYVAVPVLTIGFVLSFFRSFAVYWRYLTHYSSDLYVFSEYNSKSLMLAQDLRAHHPGALLAFAGIGESEESELDAHQETLEAVPFSGSILSLPYAWHSRTSGLFLMLTSDDETANIAEAAKLIQQLKNRDRTTLYVFHAGPQSEMVFSGMDTGKTVVRMLNEAKSLVYSRLWQEGSRLFETAGQPDQNGCREIAVSVIGMGEIGTEYIRALSWFGQMDGYDLKIDAYDPDEQAEEHFSLLCPELMDPEHNGTRVPGEAVYRITVHPGTDVRSQAFIRQFTENRAASFVIVCLGENAATVETAIRLRQTCERMGIHPVIQALIDGEVPGDLLNTAKDFRGVPYDIEFICIQEAVCSEEAVFHSELEKEALELHKRWGDEESFWKYEYNYRSSMSSVIHQKARFSCGFPGYGKTEDELTAEEKDRIARTEHCRWNAYMRSEGYVFSGSQDPGTRNDLAKMHPDLVPFDRLSQKEKEKDIRVSTKK